MRIRLSLAISLTLLLAINVLVPTLCAAHCSPSKTANHHHAAFAQETPVSMCDDCSQNSPQLHAFNCPNATQLDTRTEPAFALAVQKAVANFATLDNLLGSDHKISTPGNVPQHQPTPQNLVATAAPLRL